MVFQEHKPEDPESFCGLPFPVTGYNLSFFGGQTCGPHSVSDPGGARAGAGCALSGIYPLDVWWREEREDGVTHNDLKFSFRP